MIYNIRMGYKFEAEVHVQAPSQDEANEIANSAFAALVNFQNNDDRIVGWDASPHPISKKVLNKVGVAGTKCEDGLIFLGCADQWRAVESLDERIRALSVFNLSYIGVKVVSLFVERPDVAAFELKVAVDGRSNDDGTYVNHHYIYDTEVELVDGQVLNEEAAEAYTEDLANDLEQASTLETLFDNTAQSLIVRREWVQAFIDKNCIDGTDVIRAIASYEESGLYADVKLTENFYA